MESLLLCPHQKKKRYISKSLDRNTFIEVEIEEEKILEKKDFMINGSRHDNEESKDFSKNNKESCQDSVKEIRIFNDINYSVTATTDDKRSNADVFRKSNSLGDSKDFMKTSEEDKKMFRDDNDSKHRGSLAERLLDED